MVDKDAIMAELTDRFIWDSDIDIDPEGLVSVQGHIRLKNNATGPLGILVKFKTVKGNFWCSHTKNLTSLQGAPETVYGSFDCCFSQVTTLEHAPKIVKGDFDCSNARLKSLIGAPRAVGGNFQCHDNPRLKTLEHFPYEIGGYATVTWRKNLPLLRTLVAKGGVEFVKDMGDQDLPWYMADIAEIINQYAGQGRMAIFDCQKDLEDAGVPGNARW